MRTLRTIALCTLMVAAAAGCKKKSADSADNGSAAASGSDNGSAAASGSDTGSAAAGSDTGSAAGSAAPEVNTPPEPMDGSGSGSAAAAAIDTTNMAHKAGNCPSTVAGAETSIADSKDGKAVVITVTSKEKDGVWAIQTRAKNLAAQQKTVAKAGDKVEHSGKGTGGGGSGLCPVVSKDTKMTVKDTADGVAITLAPAGKLTFDALKADVQQRADKAAELTKETVKPGSGTGGGGGTGGGKGKHGGNRTGKGDGSGPKGGPTGAPSGAKGAGGPNGQGGGNHM